MIEVPLTKAERDAMRQWLSDHWSPGESGRWAKLLDAADALDAVKAENERLRARLQEIIDESTGQGHVGARAANIARAALNPDPEAKK